MAKRSATRSKEGNSPVAEVVRLRMPGRRSLTTSATNQREPDRHLGKWRFAVAVCLVAFAVASPVFAAEPGRPLRKFQHFITRQGDKLMDGEKEFRFIGANMPGLSLPYDYTMKLPERMTLPTPWEQEDGLKTLDQMNLRVVRIWNLPIREPNDKPADGRMTWHYVQGPGQFNEESFKVLDHLFALANRYGIRVVFSLSDCWRTSAAWKPMRRIATGRASGRSSPIPR